MTRFLISTVAFLSTIAAAQSPPVMVGEMLMQERGKLVLSSETCDNGSSQWVGFLQDRNGKILLPLCWTFVEDRVFVVYGDGDRYTYDLANIQFTPEFAAWADRRNKKEAPKPAKTPEQTL